MQAALAVPPQYPYLDALNPTQRAAAETLEGPLLVLAGAGTGKTKVLTTRLVHLLLTGKANPSQILAVTFTNKAAREMKERMAHMLGRSVEGWWLGTFHALGTRILRRHAEMVGLQPNFTILDSDDQLRLVKQLAASHNINDKQNPPRMLAAVISRWKDRGWTPAKVPPGEVGQIANGKLLKIYEEYQARLQTLNAADFGDLLLHNLTIFREQPDVLKQYQQTFRYMLVDEYQDTNAVQYQWLQALAMTHKNLCCVGDDDQSIYGWRGAEVGNILRFEEDYPGASIVRLEQNYRSTPHILAAASAVISHNSGRLGKTLWTEVDEGDKVRVRGVWDAEEEARWLGDEVETLQRQKRELNEMAILVRAGYQTREFEERFLQLGIPYQVIGGQRFYERLEIRDALAYFRLVNSQRDDLAFERIINQPKRGIGDSTVQQLHTVARVNGTGLFEAAWALVQQGDLRPKLRQTLREFVENIIRWRDLIEKDVPHTEVAAQILEESGYVAMWQAEKSPDAAGRLENLKELISAIGEFPSMMAFLEHVSLVMDNNENSQGAQITLMTLHGAKGLEFPIVFLPGWEEGVFPSQRSMDESGTAGLEEERRLAYVGITRAREKAYISYAANRRIFGSWTSSIPSRFVNELPAEHIDSENSVPQVDSGFGGGYGGGSGMMSGGAGYGQRAIGGPSQNGYSRQGARNSNWKGDTDFAAARMGERNSYGSSSYSSRSGSSSSGNSDVRRMPVSEYDNVYAGLPKTKIVNPASPWQIGDRVSHATFGDGTILLVEADKLDVQFDRAGRKKLMARFVQKA